MYSISLLRVVPASWEGVSVCCLDVLVVRSTHRALQQQASAHDAPPTLCVPCRTAAGLVGGVEFSVLPNVPAGVAAAAVLAAQAPVLGALWRRSRQLPGGFTAAVGYALLCSYVWGYHVHEKAILMVRPRHAQGLGCPRNQDGNTTWRHGTCIICPRYCSRVKQILTEISSICVSFSLPDKLHCIWLSTHLATGHTGQLQM